jgi:putative membrane protein
VVLVIGYHHACGPIAAEEVREGRNTRSHKWFRVFNEVPVFMLLAIVILVVVKPF